MKTWREEARDLPVAAEVDVLVAGGGPAGFAAAVCAARTGARTLLLEQSGGVGGVATMGLMSAWAWGTKGGIYEEILDRSAGPTPGDERYIIDSEALKAAMLDMLEEAGAGLRLHTFVARPVMAGRSVNGLVTESKSGREAFLAKVVVDATGDGDVAAGAGVPFRKGRENDGRMQPMTLMFNVGGVDTDRAVFLSGFEDTYETREGEVQAMAKKALPPPAGHVLLYRTRFPGVVSCNMTNCTGVDGTRAEDLTRAERECRRQIGPIIDFLRRHVPGYGECHLIETASMVGVRETRHFECEYELTERDILEARVFDDWAATKAFFNFDVHNLTGAGLDPTGAQKHFSQDKPYSIPYRCLLPRGAENLLLAGRDIGGTHLAHSNFRVMPICANIGQAAGTAAALCAKLGITPRALPATSLQEELRKQGVTP